MHHDTIAQTVGTAMVESFRGGVISVVTHDNLSGLQDLVASVLPDAKRLGLEFIVVADEEAPQETKDWIQRSESEFTVCRPRKNDGPGAARNEVVRLRPSAETYVFLDDDVVLRGGEIPGLLAALEKDHTVALVTGMPLATNGAALASSFQRRPFNHAFPRLWERWWDSPGEIDQNGLKIVDVAPSSAVAIRGDGLRNCGGYDAAFFPACFEDLDLYARVSFAGMRVALDPGLRVYQKVSVTMRKVFGDRYPVFCRSSGVLYAAMNYPLPFAVGRLAAALVGAIANHRSSQGQGDAHGFLRTARLWRYVLRARQNRRRLRLRRDKPHGDFARVGRE